MKCAVWGIQSIPTEYLYVVTDQNQTYYADHFEMYRNLESLCCVTGTNIVFQVNYTSKTNSEKDEVCGYQRWGWEEEGLDEGGQNVQTSGYKINKSQGCNAQRDEHN